MDSVQYDQERLRELCQRHGIARLEIFGSVAKGQAGEESDIDILYTMQTGRRLGWDIDELALALEEIFGREVDLVARKFLHPLLREEVLEVAEELYAA